MHTIGGIVRHNIVIPLGHDDDVIIICRDIEIFLVPRISYDTTPYLWVNQMIT